MVSPGLELPGLINRRIRGKRRPSKGDRPGMAQIVSILRTAAPDLILDRKTYYLLEQAGRSPVTPTPVDLTYYPVDWRTGPFLPKSEAIVLSWSASKRQSGFDTGRWRPVGRAAQ